MNKNHNSEIPARSKMIMREEIAQVVSHLHKGERAPIEPLIEDLKARSIYLDDQIQQDVLKFASQVYFQYDYDPWHKVTPEVQRAADQLLEDLGVFNLKKPL